MGWQFSLLWLRAWRAPARPHCCPQRQKAWQCSAAPRSRADGDPRPAPSPGVPGHSLLAVRLTRCPRDLFSGAGEGTLGWRLGRGGPATGRGCPPVLHDLRLLPHIRPRFAQQLGGCTAVRGPRNHAQAQRFAGRSHGTQEHSVPRPRDPDENQRRAEAPGRGQAGRGPASVSRVLTGAQSCGHADDPVAGLSRPRPSRGGADTGGSGPPSPPQSHCWHRLSGCPRGPGDRDTLIRQALPSAQRDPPGARAQILLGTRLALCCLGRVVLAEQTGR